MQIIQSIQNRIYEIRGRRVAILSGTFNSGKASRMNPDNYHYAALGILRKVLLIPPDIRRPLKELKERVGEHDAQLSHIGYS